MGFFTVGMALYSAYKQRKAGKEAEAIGQANADRAQAESDAAAARLALQQKQILATTRARAAASGIAPGSATVQSYLQNMQRTFKAEQDWIKKSGESAASIQGRQGQYQRRMANVGAWGTISSGVSAGYSQGFKF